MYSVNMELKSACTVELNQFWVSISNDIYMYMKCDQYNATQIYFTYCLVIQ